MEAGAPGPFGAAAQAGGAVEETVENFEEKIGLEDKKEAHQPISRDKSSSESSSNYLDAKHDIDRDVTALARHLTQHSVKSTGGTYQNPFHTVDDPTLDPHSGQFSPEAWIKTVLGIQSRDPERYPTRTSGVSFKNLHVHGFGSLTDYQKTFGNAPLQLAGFLGRFTGRGQHKIQILRDFEGLVKSGELLVVLGRPGSGCSTLLKTIAGETSGIYFGEESEINYQGIPMQTMHKDFRGECIYQAETDVHFPQLTVGDTLKFAAEARAPRNRMPGVTRDQYATHMRDVIMAVFGLSHTMNTKVGNDFVRGVSGGERKRVSIAEAALGQSPVQCWDNATRGLDSATALEFVRTLRLSSHLSGATCAVAIYQASQNIYEEFDKAVVLYEGRQIYFGPCHKAKEYFVKMGYHCAERAITSDFLTSLTNPMERIVREGYEHLVPRTPDEFAKRWQESEERRELLKEIDAWNAHHPIAGPHLKQFQKSREAQQAKGQRLKSPYTLSVPMQIKLCTWRGFLRLKGDSSIALSGIIGNSVIAIIIGSVFFNLPLTTSSFYSRGALLFFAILLNAFSSILEILTLYAQRPIVEKQTRYAFYHPFSEAIASVLTTLPEKFLVSLTFNLPLYWMTNLKRTPGAFFTFYVFSIACVLAMSMFFRTIGALSRSLAGALAPAAVFILAMVIYTGFAIPVRDMHPWFRWLGYLDPVAYAFESLMINEFSGSQYKCNNFVPFGPGYDNVAPDQQVCSTVGSVPGSSYVDGDRYLNQSFSYYHSHLWRNLGIILALAIFFGALYLLATEYISEQTSKGEVLLFPRTKVPRLKKSRDEEGASVERPTPDDVITQTLTEGEVPPNIQRQEAVFSWKAVNYEIKIKGEPRLILDDVDGWVKPGTLTALMVSCPSFTSLAVSLKAFRVLLELERQRCWMFWRAESPWV